MAQSSLFYKNKSVDNQISKIVKDIADIFVEDTKGILTLDLNKLLLELDTILKQVTLIEKVYINSKNQKTIFTALKRNNIKQRQLLLKGFMLLQNFRAYLTGSLVDYRYYIEENGHVSMVSLTEEQLIKYLNINAKKGMEIGFTLSSSLRTLSKNIEHSLKEQVFLNHFDNLYSTIMTIDMCPGWTYGYRVHSFIIDKYGNKDLKTPPNLWNKKGRYQQFNRGHIFEGLDISMYEAGADMMLEDPVFNYNRIKELFYTKNLAYDNVKGFKGGDNTFTNTQIKSEGADLVDFKTILNEIKKLNEILKITNGEALKQKLYDMFIDDTGKAIDQKIDDVIFNDLLEKIKLVSVSEDSFL